MSLHLLAVLIGFVIDLFLGDPRSIPHPVVAMGRLITLLEHRLRPTTEDPAAERRAGAYLWLIVVVVSGVVPLLILWGGYAIHPAVGVLLESLMCWQILATRSLLTSAKAVERPLRKGDLMGARHAVSMIVGRDTAALTEEGVTKATVETVAENTSDGIIAPLFFMALGGAPMGMVYKAVNTMDSMIGYIDPPYTNFGRWAARADDIFNYLPARLSALLMLLVGGILGMNMGEGWRIFRRDRYRHASPNSAQTESVVAGLLGVQLAGDATYGGHLHRKPFIGDATRPIVPEDITRSCRLALGTALLALLLLILLPLTL